MSEVDLRGLLETLRDHEVEFVVVGAVAVAAHGYVRATADLDVVPDPSAENLDRLARAISNLEATLPLAGGRRFDLARDGPVVRGRRNVTLDTASGGLDVLQRVPGVPGFAVLAADAVESDLLGVRVRLCSLSHLREMKRSSGRTQDRADLENLPPA